MQDNKDKIQDNKDDKDNVDKENDFTTISIRKDTHEKLLRRKTHLKDSMESVITRLINKDSKGYVVDIDIQSKKDILKKIKVIFEEINQISIELSNLNKIVNNLSKDIAEELK